MIYFMQRASDKAIKIGTTIRLSLRMQRIEESIGEAVVVLGVRDGSYSDEGALHVRFSAHHKGNEWFEPAPDLIQFIREETVSWDGTDEKEVVGMASFKGSEAFREWVIELAERSRLNLPTLFEHATIEYAKVVGFTKPAPKR